jgi:hypothetical protein
MHVKWTHADTLRFQSERFHKLAAAFLRFKEDHR